MESYIFISVATTPIHNFAFKENWKSTASL